MPVCVVLVTSFAIRLSGLCGVITGIMTAGEFYSCGMMMESYASLLKRGEQIKLKNVSAIAKNGICNCRCLFSASLFVLFVLKY